MLLAAAPGSLEEEDCPPESLNDATMAALLCNDDPNLVLQNDTFSLNVVARIA